ncbi:Fic/DOC family N-terminal domain-containing protein [Neolewinella lacunae]|uniref:Fic family protein n=1 Tax=Neolewinella lacunae TaxID=1517758 RepID=A0A923T9J8_9BACT|nr:Fic/DOC family N-terminal domain-containing protein [Neolewinella lacunae]MBC6995636.1 Fic family protein [Neolewinella lacunae]MDN3634297.1 Fic/DOC family N-terminal domain-containing protein [Neolewinella lacunae]
MDPFKPSLLPLRTLDLNDYKDLVGPANRAVARYDGLLHAMINPELLLSPLRTQEAVLSSRIEGTVATYQDVASYDAKMKIPDGQAADLEEVINYRSALGQAREDMLKLPLTLNLVRSIHHTLMNGVRGHNSARGEFRRIQNWIGPPNCTLENATYVPPATSDMLDALYNWEKYLHEEDIDIMIQLAVVHAQFEIIHPFLDGNGRIGRILIPLFLYHKEVIHTPYFYMSDYLESNRRDYYRALKAITQDNDWKGWIRFFLVGVIEQAEKSTKQASETLGLYEKMKHEIVRVTNSQYSIPTLDYLFEHPIFSNQAFFSDSGIPRRTANRIIDQLLREQIINVIKQGSGRTPSLYKFHALLKIVNR